MNALSWILLALLAVWFLLTLRRLVRKRGNTCTGCSGCAGKGNCRDCRHCGSNK